MRFRAAWRVTRRSMAMSLAFALCLTASAAGVWMLANATMPHRVSPPTGGLHLSLHVIEGERFITYGSNDSRNNTAFALLLEAARTLHLEFKWENWTVPSDSIFVVSVDDLENGHDGRWWQYWVNGAYGNVGADKMALNDGDLVEWRFAQYPP